MLITFSLLISRFQWSLSKFIKFYIKIHLHIYTMLLYVCSWLTLQEIKAQMMECFYSNLIPDLSIVLSFLATILKYCTLPHMMEQFAVVMSTNKFLVWWLYLFLFNLFGDTERIPIKWRLFASILATLQKDTQISLWETEELLSDIVDLELFTSL